MPSKGITGNIDPAAELVAANVDDAVDLTNGITRAIWVGSAGNVSVVDAAGNTVTITGIPAGSLLPFQIKRIRSTNTTVTSPTTNILAVY